MTAPHGQGPPRSTVADVMRSVVEHYIAVSDPTVFYIGEEYLKTEGAPGRIILVRGGGKAGGPQTFGAGNVATFAQSFTAYVWGAEAADRLARYTAVDAMVDRYVNALRKIIPGRCEIRTIDPAVETNVVTFGEELQVVAVYSRPIPRDAAIWDVPITPVSPPDAMRPNGDTGLEYVLETSVEPTREAAEEE